MKARTVIMFILAATVLIASAPLLSQEEVKSLRGVNPVEDPSYKPESKRMKPDSAPIPRDFVQQPPLIPHDTKGYQINLKFNKCLTCHSWANYEQSGATKISQTHFTNREGIEMANVSAARYFCTQCHVPQRDVRPLVENEFEPVEALQ
jgi:cytochrome c-type protein NapB